MGGESNVVPIQQSAGDHKSGQDNEGTLRASVGDAVGMGTEAGGVLDYWEGFWTLYPRHEAKKDARKAWDRLLPAEQVQAIIAISDWRRVWQDQNRDVTVIPLPATWLRGERWEDEIPKELRPGLKAMNALANGGDIPAQQPAKALEIPQYVKDQIAKLRGRV